MREGFLMGTEAAMLFFRACRLYKVNDEASRIGLLRKITARHKAKYLRDADAFIQGKSVLKIKPRGDR